MLVNTHNIYYRMMNKITLNHLSKQELSGRKL